MTAKASEDTGLSIPLRICLHGASQNNGTCAEQLSSFFPPFSSTFALIVLVAMIVGIIIVSLATFHFHKRKMRKRKIQRAQEEYERDSRSPAAGAKEPLKPCIIVRPPGSGGAAAGGGAVRRGDDQKPAGCHTQETDPPSTAVSQPDTALPEPDEPGQTLHTVVSS